MFKEWKAKRAAAKAAKHKANCDAGKHDWMLWAEDTMAYSYSSTGGCDPTYTQRTYKCKWCGAEKTETDGSAEEYRRAIEITDVWT